MWRGDDTFKLRTNVSWNFFCRCPRCLDPTELGTEFSSLRCPSCSIDRPGYLVPVDPIDPASNWWNFKQQQIILKSWRFEFKCQHSRDFYKMFFFSLKCFLTIFQGVWRLPKNRAGDLCQRRHSVKFVLKFHFIETFYFGEINFVAKICQTKFRIPFFSDPLEKNWSVWSEAILWAAKVLSRSIHKIFIPTITTW